MSKYKTIQTEFRNIASLQKALADLGFTANKVEVDATRKNTLQMYGYHGDLRPETVSVRIQRKYVTTASNDVGFRWNGTSYEAVISDFDSSANNPFSTANVNKLKQRYAYHEAKRIAYSKGYSVSEKTQADGTISLVLMRR
jgi:hypothetical protein